MRFRSRYFGVAAPELGWVPAPSYILRRAIILDLLATYPPGLVLEIGSASGALLYDLAQRGFFGLGVEQSSEALAVATQILTNVSAFRVVDRLPEDEIEHYDYVLAFEVLEHIEEDQAALQTWASYLKRGGILMISVPARHHRWNASDVWAGHYRRYERTGIGTRVDNAGFDVLATYSYGWPLSNLLEPIGAWVHGRQLKRAAHANALPVLDKQSRTARSGIQRTVEARLYPMYANWFGAAIFSICSYLQQRVSSTDLGTGYLVLARKR
jgi:SAM-dependent methyltransferase